MYGSRIHPIVSCKAFHPPSINIAAIKASHISLKTFGPISGKT